MAILKKGLAPVIASLLLILLVLVLASIVFAWARGFVEDEGKSSVTGRSIDSLCNAIDVDVVFTERTEENYKFEAVNRGDVNISSLKFRVYPGGSSNIVNFDVNLFSGGSVVGDIVLTGEGDLPVEKIEALCVLDGDMVGKSSDVVCLNTPLNLDILEVSS